MSNEDESKEGLSALLKRIGTVRKEEESPKEGAESGGAGESGALKEKTNLAGLMKRIQMIRPTEDEMAPSAQADAGPPPAAPQLRSSGGEAEEGEAIAKDGDSAALPAARSGSGNLEQDLRSVMEGILKSPEGGETSITEGDEPRTETPEHVPPTTQPSPATPVRDAKRTQWSSGNERQEKIISIDQISDISDLILPKGATFEIDEVKLRGRTSIFDATNIGTLPSEIDEIWRTGLPSVGLKDISIGSDRAQEDESARTGVLGRFRIFKAIRSEVEEYNRKIHGPLVDLTLRVPPGVEEIELYPVNEPYAYIRVTYDNTTHEYTYHVLEPELNEAEKELLSELKERLFETLDVNTKDLTKETAKKALRTAVDDITADYGIKLTPVSREKIMYNIEKEFVGDGLIDAIMHDKYIEDISCDGVGSLIFVYHTSYENIKTNLMYKNANELDSFVTKLAQRAGKYISIAEPMLDATMSDGSRIQMTLGTEVTAHGSTFTIRKFREEPITPTDLIEWSTFSPLSIAYLWLAVENGKSCIFAGGTASGKTTSLNAISLFIPPNAKIITLEDTRELKLPHPNWIPSVTRSSFDSAGKGEIDMYELLRAALRQRPEYLLVGEVRGREALTLFQAMSTGHVTYSTMHADSVASVVHRLENPPLNVPRNMLSALKLVSVQVQARVGGQRIRRNKQLIEILDIDPRTNELITNEVFRWNPATDEIRYSGKSFILEEIMEDRGWSEARMKEELKRRQELLEWMRLKMIRHYTDVSKMLISYHRDPEAVVNLVRGDLYGEGRSA
ncbi:MAG: type II/IV secretion system ATPase subunit [Methanomicrobiales archaeon]|nr:type II/IV secretion system ATPase subunit [Methanomicrobiales archaeon]MDI6875276.1 type II/IV secretion system ATPase subunit [Methanomicrobiales archaeon]